MRTAVVGGGAMGAAFAADAAAAGHDVTIVDTAADVVDRIRNHGVTVETPDGTISVPVHATIEPAEVGTVDVAVVLVKGYDTRAAARTVAALLGPGAVAVTLQNGWGNADVLASVVPPEQLLMGVTYHSCSSAGPGHVRHTGRGPTVVGPYLVDADAVGSRAASRPFSTAAGWEAQASADIRTEIWKKLVLNAATLPAAALHRSGNRRARPTWSLARPGRRAGPRGRRRRPRPGTGHRPGRTHRADPRRAAGGGPASRRCSRTSKPARKTEIETINGAVARMGVEHGIDVSLNLAMVALVSAVERSWRR